MKKIIAYNPIPQNSNLTEFEAQFITLHSNPTIKPLIKKINGIPAHVPTQDSIYQELIVPTPLDDTQYPNVEALLAPDALAQNFLQTFTEPPRSAGPIDLDSQTVSSIANSLEELKPILEDFSDSMCRLAKNEKMFVESLQSAVGQNYFFRSSMHYKNYIRQLHWYDYFIRDTHAYLRHQFTTIKTLFSNLDVYMPNFLHYILSPSKVNVISNYLPSNAIYPFGEFLQSFYSFIYITTNCIDKIQGYRSNYIYYLAQPLTRNPYLDYLSPEIGLRALCESAIYSRHSFYSEDQLLHMLYIFRHPQPYREENLKWVLDYYMNPFRELRHIAIDNQNQIYTTISNTVNCKNLSWVSNLQTQHEFFSHAQEVYYQSQIVLYKPIYAKPILDRTLDIYTENFVRLYDLTGTVTTTYTPYLFGTSFVCVSATILYNYYFGPYHPLIKLAASYMVLPAIPQIGVILWSMR